LLDFGGKNLIKKLEKQTMFVLIVRRFSTKEQTPQSKPNHQNPNDKIETSSLLVATCYIS
jgi:hypothetical protein